MFEDKTTAALKAQVLSEIDPTVGISTMAGSYADAVAGPLCRQVSELYNSVPLWLADRLGELEGLSFLTLWFTRESAAQCEAVVQSSAEGRPMPGASSEKTRGLYYRTVL